MFPCTGIHEGKAISFFIMFIRPSHLRTTYLHIQVNNGNNQCNYMQLYKYIIIYTFI